MDKYKDKKNKISNDTLNLATALVKLDKKTRNYGLDVPIFYSEIHVIMVIAQNPGINVGGLAEIIGITKGAVSETLKKLEKKELIVKELDDLNLSRYLLYLTKKGEVAHRNHMYYHSVLESVIEDELEGASNEELDLLSGFLTSVMNKVMNFNENFE